MLCASSIQQEGRVVCRNARAYTNSCGQGPLNALVWPIMWSCGRRDWYSGNVIPKVPAEAIANCSYLRSQRQLHVEYYSIEQDSSRMRSRLLVIRETWERFIYKLKICIRLQQFLDGLVVMSTINQPAIFCSR
jgi:hypothetical protein